MLVVSEIPSSEKPAEEIKQKWQNDTDQDRGCNGKIKWEILFFIEEVTGESAEVERKLVAEEKKGSQYDDHNTHKDKHFSKFCHDDAAPCFLLL